MLEKFIAVFILLVLTLFLLHTNMAYNLWDKYYIDSVCPLIIDEKAS